MANRLFKSPNAYGLIMDGDQAECSQWLGFAQAQLRGILARQAGPTSLVLKPTDGVEIRLDTYPNKISIKAGGGLVCHATGATYPITAENPRGFNTLKVYLSEKSSRVVTPHLAGHNYYTGSGGTVSWEAQYVYLNGKVCVMPFAVSAAIEVTSSVLAEANTLYSKFLVLVGGNNIYVYGVHKAQPSNTNQFTSAAIASYNYGLASTGVRVWGFFQRKDAQGDRKLYLVYSVYNSTTAVDVLYMRVFSNSLVPGSASAIWSSKAPSTTYSSTSSPGTSSSVETADDAAQRSLFRVTLRGSAMTLILHGYSAYSRSSGGGGSTDNNTGSVSYSSSDVISSFFEVCSFLEGAVTVSTPICTFTGRQNSETTTGGTYYHVTNPSRYNSDGSSSVDLDWESCIPIAFDAVAEIGLFIRATLSLTGLATSSSPGDHQVMTITDGGSSYTHKQELVRVKGNTQTVLATVDAAGFADGGASGALDTNTSVIHPAGTGSGSTTAHYTYRSVYSWVADQGQATSSDGAFDGRTMLACYTFDKIGGGAEVTHGIGSVVLNSRTGLYTLDPARLDNFVGPNKIYLSVTD